MRGDCGPIQTIKKKRLVFVSKKQKSALPGQCPYQGMEDAQVGDRELQATTDRNKGMRTTAVTIPVDLGRWRAARIAWSENS